MKKNLLIAGGIALIASGLAYYFLSRTKKNNRQSGEPEGHHSQAAGEKMLRRALRQGKKRAATGG